jgi:hypothetical protein
MGVLTTHAVGLVGQSDPMKEDEEVLGGTFSSAWPRLEHGCFASDEALERPVVIT